MIPAIDKRRHCVAPTFMAMALSALLLGASWTAAAACRGPYDDEVKGPPSGVYRGHTAGDALTDWLRAGKTVLTCDGKTVASITVAPAGAYVGEYDGRATFATPNAKVGYQLEYRYPESVDSDGATSMSGWIRVEQTSRTFTMYGGYAHHWDPTNPPDSNIQLEFDIRYIALEELTGDESIGYTQAVQLTDNTYGTAFNQLLWTPFRLERYVAPSCWFGTLPSPVPMAETSMWDLPNAGDASARTTFNWSYSCSGTGLSGATVIYGSTNTIVDASKGLIAVDDDGGAATGVVLEVRREVSGSGNGTAVRLNSSYALPASATERMQVRYIRTADPIQAGTANGNLTIELTPR